LIRLGFSHRQSRWSACLERHFAPLFATSRHYTRMNCGRSMHFRLRNNDLWPRLQHVAFSRQNSDLARYPEVHYQEARSKNPRTAHDRSIANRFVVCSAQKYRFPTLSIENGPYWQSYGLGMARNESRVPSRIREPATFVRRRSPASTRWAPPRHKRHDLASRSSPGQRHGVAKNCDRSGEVLIGPPVLNDSCNSDGRFARKPRDGIGELRRRGVHWIRVFASPFAESGERGTLCDASRWRNGPNDTREIPCAAKAVC
jgi:hypothetical protein